MSLRRALGFILFLFTTVSCHSQQPAPLRSNNEAWNRADLGIQALQQWYVPETGLYRGTGWWNAANVLTALTDYMRISGSRRFVTVLATTYTQAQITVPEEQRVGPLEKMTGFPGFLNKYYDDEGWWALAWIDAYDLTRDERYLASAQSIFDDMAEAWDSTCGGGIWWSRDRTYKNAIANELFFSVAAHLATRVSASRQRYTDWATREWKWFGASGMVNKRHLVNDGLLIDKVAGTCRNNGRAVWTYNQGVLLGALAEFSQVNANSGVLRDARLIADASLTNLTDKDGILHDSCEPKCNADGVQFKGIFMRNLRELYEIVRDPRYLAAFTRNADSIWTRDRTPENRFGEVWCGPPGTPKAGSHSSALDALIAAIPGQK